MALENIYYLLTVFEVPGEIHLHQLSLGHDDIVQMRVVVDTFT